MAPNKIASSNTNATQNPSGLSSGAKAATAGGGKTAGGTPTSGITGHARASQGASGSSGSTGHAKKVRGQTGGTAPQPGDTHLAHAQQSGIADLAPPSGVSVAPISGALEGAGESALKGLGSLLKRGGDYLYNVTHGTVDPGRTLQGTLRGSSGAAGASAGSTAGPGTGPRALVNENGTLDFAPRPGNVTQSSNSSPRYPKQYFVKGKLLGGKTTHDFIVEYEDTGSFSEHLQQLRQWFQHAEGAIEPRVGYEIASGRDLPSPTENPAGWAGWMQMLRKMKLNGENDVDLPGAAITQSLSTLVDQVVAYVKEHPDR